MRPSRSSAGLLAAIACMAIAATLAHAQSQPPRDLTMAGRRLALVVGIDTYARSPLLNARNDARSMAATLRELGFTVTLLEDISRTQMVTSVSAFSESLKPEDVAFFFYAGHGLQVDGENYLVPADFDGSSPTAVRLNTLPVGEIQAALGRAKVSVLVLDACRNNPFANTRSGGRGLAPMEARGNIIAFATGAGQTSSDNPAAGNGLFTQQLLSTLREPNLPLREIFYRVRQRVYDASNGQQFPAVYDGLLGEVVLRTDGTGAAAPPIAAASASKPAPPPPTPAASSPAPAVRSDSGFELVHLGRSGLAASMHPGRLAVSRGRLKWSEDTANSKDDFAVFCADVSEISAKSRYGETGTGHLKDKGVDYESNAYVKVSGRNYDFWVVLDERTDATRPTTAAVIDAIRGACPAVKVK